MNSAADQTFQEGNKIIQMANEPVFSATGTNITPDFKRTIDHCQTVLDELQERKQRSDELSDVRKLRLQQCLQLRTCERDAQQVCLRFSFFPQEIFYKIILKTWSAYKMILNKYSAYKMILNKYSAYKTILKNVLLTKWSSKMFCLQNDPQKCSAYKTILKNVLLTKRS